MNSSIYPLLPAIWTKLTSPHWARRELDFLAVFGGLIAAAEHFLREGWVAVVGHSAGSCGELHLRGLTVCEMGKQVAPRTTPFL
jgi:hypothetical protein